MSKQVRLFWFVTVGTIAWIFVMRPFTPPNIIEFEFAHTVDNALRIINEWGASGVEKAKMSIYLDFVFLVLYSWAISLGCRVASEFSGHCVLVSIGTFLAKVIWIAAVCDLAENVAMLLTLQNVEATWVAFAFWAAGIKFSIVIGSLLFVLLATAVGVMKKLDARR